MLGGGTVFRIALVRYYFIHMGEAERVAAAMHDSFSVESDAHQSPCTAGRKSKLVPAAA